MICWSELQDIVDVVQGLATILALALGGVWGYLLFVRRRQRYPRAAITHRAVHHRLAGGKVLLHVAAIISNPGEVLLSLVCWETRVQQVLPLPELVQKSIAEGRDPVPPGATEVEWPLLAARDSGWKKGQCEVEPGESHEIHHDFILPAGVETVEVYSYFRNEKKRGRDIGWSTTTLFDLRVEGASGSRDKGDGADG